MKKIFHITALVLAASMLFTGCKWDEYDPEKGLTDEEKEELIVRTEYTNPIIATSGYPDPSVIKGDDGYFYMYASDEGHSGMSICRSRNLVDWTYLHDVFTSNNRPSWANSTNIGLWAPSAAKVGNKYVVYYALANYSNDDIPGARNWGYGIGAAVSDNPDGPFIDKGCLLRSSEIRVQCSIDPCYYEDNGTKYMIWGSFFGIWAVELTDDGLSVKDPQAKVHLAGSRGAAWGLEAAMIYKKDGYYYLFGSVNGTGYNENYQVTVFRSESLLGPYEDKDGNAAISNTRVGETLLCGNLDGLVISDFRSTGHSSEIITDKEGTDWVFFHAYKEGGSGDGRWTLLEKVTWVDGWPQIGREVEKDGVKYKVANTTCDYAPKF